MDIKDLDDLFAIDRPLPKLADIKRNRHIEESKRPREVDQDIYEE